MVQAYIEILTREADTLEETLADLTIKETAALNVVLALRDEKRDVKSSLTAIRRRLRQAGGKSAPKE